MGDGLQYIHELENSEGFVSLIEFNRFEDIGFNPSDINIESNSHFAFLTFDRLKCQSTVNLIFIDTNRTEPTFKFLRSTKRIISKCSRLEEDVVIKNIMYSTKKNNMDYDYEIKILTQYPEHFQLNAL